MTIKEKEELISKINQAFQEMSILTKDRGCKYWKVEAFGYREEDREAVNDKFFPEQVKDKVIEKLTL